MNKMAKSILTEDTAVKLGTASNRSSILQLSATFVVGFLCIYIRSFFSMTSLLVLPELLDDGLLLLGSIFLLFHVLFHSKEYGKRIIPLLLIIIACAYAYLASGETIPLTVTLCIIAAATAGNVRDIAKLWFAVTAMSVAYLVVVSGITAILEPDRLSYSYRYAGGTARFSFFFSHPNMFAAIVMMMCGIYMYLRYEWLRFSSFVVLALIAAATFLFTDSRTSFTLTLLEIICFAVQRERGLFSGRWVTHFVGVMPILLFVLVYLISGPLYRDSLGSLLTGRVSLWHNCFVTQGITILGQQFEPSRIVSSTGWVSYFGTLDCVYASGLYVFGLVFSGFFCWCVFARTRREDSRLGIELPLILVLLLFGVTEVHALNPVLCVPLLFLAGGILPKESHHAWRPVLSNQAKSSRG
ncbi:hypothetical protein [Collinsella ihumii]|uniref:O-antigen ligase domain-containing protein n=1 Tax=Collinsella ihumii TaxID=1720204 RepID=A0ABT7XH37_9ACTN|nr:hypothetical protein [Collinsella ihumii]MDN0064729.1 hypothetical protein [Collinsella ihumii]